MEFLLDIQNGRPVNPDKANNIIAHLKDGKYLFKVTKYGDRSLNQNAYFHGVVLPIIVEGLRELGWEHIQNIEDAKDVVKMLFLTRQVANIKTGETITRILKTSELTKVEFHEFLEEVIRFGVQELSVKIPPPSAHIKNYDPYN